MWSLAVFGGLWRSLAAFGSLQGYVSVVLDSFYSVGLGMEQFQLVGTSFSGS